MQKRYHPISTSEELDSEGFEEINSLFDLPAAEEFACTNEEVREVCAAFRDIESLQETS